jgi:hypothetical protein
MPQVFQRQKIFALAARVRVDWSGVALGGGEAAAFADDAQISAWAKDAVHAMARARIIKGVGNNLFAPADAATRAEVATLLSRFVQTYVKI